MYMQKYVIALIRILIAVRAGVANYFLRRHIKGRIVGTLQMLIYLNYI